MKAFSDQIKRLMILTTSDHESYNPPNLVLLFRRNSAAYSSRTAPPRANAPPTYKSHNSRSG